MVDVISFHVVGVAALSILRVLAPSGWFKEVADLRQRGEVQPREEVAIASLKGLLALPYV